MKKEPYKWQLEARRRFKDAIAFMLNICCGGGKSLAATMIAQDKQMPVLIIAPKNLCEETWRTELLENGVAEEDIFVFDQPTYSKNKEAYERSFEQWLQQ